jgi:hypothetical protein
VNPTSMTRNGANDFNGGENDLMTGPKRLKSRGGIALPVTLTSWRGQLLGNLFIFYESDEKSLKETRF